MLPIRIIPRLDIKSLNLVKGVNMEGLRVLGDPSQFAINYYLDGADEIFYQDIVASLYDRKNLIDILDKAPIWEKNPNVKICCKAIGAKIIELQTKIDDAVTILQKEG
jgi:imidazole glycerol phosphate synthase subunit HisF